MAGTWMQRVAQGWLAEKIGAPLTVSLGGLVCLLAAAWFARPEGRVVCRGDL